MYIPVFRKPRYSVRVQALVRRCEIPVKTVAADCCKEHKRGEPGDGHLVQQELAGLVNHDSCTARNKQVTIKKKTEYFSGQGHCQLQVDHDWRGFNGVACVAGTVSNRKAKHDRIVFGGAFFQEIVIKRKCDLPIVIFRKFRQKSPDGIRLIEAGWQRENIEAPHYRDHGSLAQITFFVKIIYTDV